MPGKSAAAKTPPSPAISSQDLKLRSLSSSTLKTLKSQLGIGGNDSTPSMGGNSQPPPPPPRFKTTARDINDSFQLGSTIRKEDRRKLTTSERLKLRQEAVTKLEPKFANLSVGDSDDQLKNTYSLHMQLQRVIEHFEKHDIKDVFTIYTLDENGSPQGDPLDLLTEYASAEEDDVRKWVEFLRKYGQDYDIENLVWSEEVLQLSCEDNLSMKLTKRMYNIPRGERGGPTYFYHMMETLSSSSADSICTLTAKIKSMKLSNYEGEDVTIAVRQLSGAIIRLDSVEKGAVPKDIDEILVQIFLTGSVQEFTKNFELIKTMIKIKVKSYNPEELLKEAEKLYVKLRENGKWTRHVLNLSTSPCWVCGKAGHLAKNCPDQKGINNLDNNDEGSKGGQNNGNGSEQGNNQEHNFRARKGPKFIPPGQGEPDEREYKGIKLLW